MMVRDDGGVVIWKDGKGLIALGVGRDFLWKVLVGSWHSASNACSGTVLSRATSRGLPAECQ